MNLFFLSRRARRAARFHCNRHVVKMILETAQLLSTAHRVLDGSNTIQLADGSTTPARKGTLPDLREDVLYRLTHVNHPCAVWVRQTRSNYLWAFDLLEALLEEYTYRYGREHKTSRLVPLLSTPPTNLPDGPLTPPALAMPDEYKVSTGSQDVCADAIASYRSYYIKGKSHLHQWKERPPPKWLLKAPACVETPLSVVVSL